MSSQAVEFVSKVRFGPFVFDPVLSELQKQGLRIRLQGQPGEVLHMLLERPGRVVTREDLQKKLWPADTYVDFEHSLNTAVKRLRRALNDSADKPRYIETVPRRGYRFIAPVTHAHAGKEVAIRSLAVLPFENTGGENESEYLSDGIAETIISTLSRRPDLRVMARSSVFRYRNRTADARAVGRRLNVDAVLTGRVRWHGEELTVAAELVDVSNGWQIWGHRYRSGISDLFSLQEEISREISRGLSLRLMVAAGKPVSVDPEAYRDYLKGRYHWNRMTEEGLRKAVAHFEQAIERDPGYALPYVGLSDCLSLFPFVGLASPDEAMPKAKEAARRALRIDDELAEAHASLAGIRKLYDWDWAGAEDQYRRALALDPNYETGRRFYAAYLCAVGRIDEAVAEIQRAHELDPLSLVISMEIGWDYYMGRRYERAREQALKTVEMEPAFLPAHHVLGLACEQLGRREEAIAAFEHALAGSRHPATLAALGHALATANRRSEAADLLKEIEALSSTSYVPPYWRAVICVGLGDYSSAVDHLRTSCAQRDVWLVWLKQDPRFDQLRSHPGFDEVFRQLRMPD
jgi:TolB-like protein/Tfp pilus assembly protein PilF